MNNTEFPNNLFESDIAFILGQCKLQCTATGVRNITQMYHMYYIARKTHLGSDSNVTGDVQGTAQSVSIVLN